MSSGDPENAVEVTAYAVPVPVPVLQVRPVAV